MHHARCMVQNKNGPFFHSFSFDTIENMAQPTHDLDKIFVGGLSWQTTEESLRYHFEQYGEVVSVEVMRDRNTGEPRGFAFVVFKDNATVDLVMDNLPHEINHKIVDVKRAQARGSAPPSIHTGDSQQTQPVASSVQEQREPTPEELQNKIFVGGLPLHIDKDGLSQFFSQFGAVTDSIVMMDHVQNRSRGFGFVTFENGSHGAQKALEAQPIYIDGKFVELKLATPKGDQQKKSHTTTGLRNAAAVAVATSQPTGQFGGLAASYGRSGWKAGYGSYAFGSQGWAVDGWEDLNTVTPEKTGFSFDLIGGTHDSGSGSTRGKRGGDYHPVEAKRPRVN